MTTFLGNGWIRETKFCKGSAQLKVKALLLILGALDALGHNTPFRCNQRNNGISAKKNCLFFHVVLESMYGMRDDWVSYPQTAAELRKVMAQYAAMNVPGAGGSIDVVHLK